MLHVAGRPEPAEDAEEDELRRAGERLAGGTEGVLQSAIEVLLHYLQLREELLCAPDGVGLAQLDELGQDRVDDRKRRWMLARDVDYVVQEDGGEVLLAE